MNNVYKILRILFVAFHSLQKVQQVSERERGRVEKKKNRVTVRVEDWKVHYKDIRGRNKKEEDQEEEERERGVRNERGMR